MTVPPRDLETARRIATEEALKAEGVDGAPRRQFLPKPTAAEVVHKGPSPVRIARAR